MADLEEISPTDRLFDLVDLAPSPQSLQLQDLLSLWREVRASEEVPLRESLVQALESDKASHCFEFARRDEGENFQMISAGQGVESLIEGAEPGMTLKDMSEQRLAVYLRRLISLAIERQEAIGVWFTLPEPNGPKLHIEALALPTLTDAGQWRVFVGLIPTPEKRG